MTLFVRYNMIYRSAAGTAVYVTSLRREGMEQIRRAQEQLGSTDFETAVDHLPWHPIPLRMLLESIFRDPARPTWEECQRFIAHCKSQA